MTDPYRLTGGPDSPDRPSPAVTRAVALRRLVWVLLVASLVGNTVVSFGGVPTMVHLALGVVAGLCVVVLAAPHLRSRR